MALNDIQISGLANTTEVQVSDLFVLQRGGANFNVTREDLLKFHTIRTDNPHQVTKTQVGLSNLHNFTSSD